MQPTEILSGEHRVIEQVLDCLDKMVQRYKTEGKLDMQSVKDAVDFFRNFADRCHHGKEETHLFPAMEAKGMPRDGGPTGVMLYEHEQGRKYVRGMDESIEGIANGDVASKNAFVQNAQLYINLLREHIQKEDHCLFAMANNVLNEQDQQVLSAAFEKVETEEIGEGIHEKYLKIADDLAKKYGVPIVQNDHLQEHACGCGH
jgi:hemerythrin-like domain-containing protein